MLCSGVGGISDFPSQKFDLRDFKLDISDWELRLGSSDFQVKTNCAISLTKGFCAEGLSPEIRSQTL
jgi:hypothetical protein